jgi:hypothetical protein
MTCPRCRDIRFKLCFTCGRGQNSFCDFRDYGTKPQMYPMLTDWYRDGERRPEPRVPERHLQPPKD